MAATITHTKAAYPGGGAIQKHTLAWVSHTDGSVDLDSQVIAGEILRVVFVPDSGGTQPTNLYDVLLKDAAGIDVLAGQGANLANNANSHVCPGVPLKDGTTTTTRPIVVNEVLNLEVTNAGSGKGGQVVLYVR